MRKRLFTLIILGALLLISLIYVPNYFNNSGNEKEKVRPVSIHLGMIGKYMNLPVYLDINFSQYIDHVPMIRIVRKPISKELAYKIVEDVFGLDPDKAWVVEDGSGGYDFVWDDGQIELHIYGYNKILFNSPLIRSLKPPSEEEAKSIAMNFLRKLWKFYPPPPELNIEVDRVGPDSSILVGSKVIVKSLRVIFRLSMFKVGMWGPGADYRLSICGDRVIGAEINHIWAEKIGEVKITVSPGEALARFLNGENDWGMQLAAPWPSKGELHITRFELVYYIPHPYSSQGVKIMYYIRCEVNGTVITPDETYTLNYTFPVLIDATK